MKWPGAKFPLGVLVATLVGVPAIHADTGPSTAVPGTLNYVEGQVVVGEQPVDARSIGTCQLQAGESLTTRDGRAEVLLTPGVFLRVDHQSSVNMISPSLTSTELAVDRGEALVEVDELHGDNDLRITVGNLTTQLRQTGLYDFDADQGFVRVLDGQAIVYDGSRMTKVKSGWQLSLNENQNPIPARFDKRTFDATALYRWSRLRSEYLAEANAEAARRYDVGGWYGPDGYGPGGYGPGWLGAGWYWDPWLSGYTFIPADGVYYSTFGWRFDSPRSEYLTPRFHNGDRDDWAARLPVERGREFGHHEGREFRGGEIHHERSDRGR